MSFRRNVNNFVFHSVKHVQVHAENVYLRGILLHYFIQCVFARSAMLSTYSRSLIVCAVYCLAFFSVKLSERTFTFVFLFSIIMTATVSLGRQ